MQIVTTKVKVAAVATGLAMAVSMLSFVPMAQAAGLTQGNIDAIIGFLSGFNVDAATIANVRASLNGQPTTGTVGTVGSTPSSSCSFTKTLKVGSKGADVKCLQNGLKAGGYLTGTADGSFGKLTKAGVIKWQVAVKVTPADGLFGAKSKAAWNLGGSTASPSGTVGGVTPPVTAGTGNGLKVTLAADSPSGVALVQLQSAGDLAHFTFANPTGADIKVTNVAFKRIGASVDSTLSNVYLFDGVARITDPASISNSAFSFNDTTGIFTVPAGGTKTISVRADIANTTNGQQIGVQLVNATPGTGALDSSVVFPINGGTQTISSATLAAVAFGTVTPTGNTSLSPGNDITVFQSTVTVSTRAALLKSITFENRGSTVDADFQNLKLLVKGVQVGSTIAKTTNKKVTFDFSANPIRIESGTAQFRLQADIVGGSGDTADFQIRRAVDAQLLDSNLMQAMVVTGSLSAVTANTIEGVSLSVTKANNSPSANVALDAKGVKLASFEFRAVGDDLKIEQITASSTVTGAVGLNGGMIYLNGVNIGSTQDLTGTGTAFSLGSSMILTRGTTAIVDIYADAKSAADASLTSGDTILIGVSVATADTEGVKSGNRLTTAISNVTSNTLTVTSSSLTASKVGSYANQSVVAGKNNFKLGSFTLLAGANEGVNLNTIAIAFAAAEASTLTNLRLVTSDNPFGSTKSSIAGAATDNTFSGNVNLAASGSMTVDVYADVKSSANAGPISATTVTIATGGPGLVTGNSIVITAATLQTMTVVTGGTITAASNTGGTPANAIVVGGATGVKVGSFSFLATNSDITVNKMLIKVPASSASAVSLITLKNASTGATLKAQGFTLSASGGLLYSTSAFEGLVFVIPAGTSRAVDVYVDVAPITSDNKNLSGSAISVLVDAGEGFEAADGANNLTTSINSGTDLTSVGTNIGTAYVRKSVPTLSTDASVANGANAPINSTSLANAVIGRFTVTADSHGDVDWGKIAFNVTKSAAVLLDATTTIKVFDVTGGAHTPVAGTFATSTESTVTGLQMFTTAATTGIIDFRPTSVQTVTMNSSKIYQVETTVGGLTTTLGVSLSIAGPSTSANAAGNLAAVAGTQGAPLTTSVPSFAWSDWSDSTTHFTSPTTSTDWINDYLVKGLGTIGNRAMP